MRSDYTRIKFYSRQDLSIGPALNFATKFLQQFPDEFTPVDINDILELYNIQLLFNCGMRLPDWSDAQYAGYSKMANSFSRIIGKFLSEITDDTLTTIYSQVIRQYKDDFWEVVVNYKIYKKFSPETFSNCLISNKIFIQEILKQKALVIQFSDVILQHFLSTPQHAELLIEQFLIQSDRCHYTYYFPADLTQDQKTDLLTQYVDSENPNPRFLQVLINPPISTDLCIPDKLRLNAKRKYKRFCDENFFKGDHLESEITVETSSQIPEAVQTLFTPNKLVFTYNPEWIKENPDYPTLLNNFIYIFGYTDTQFRSNFPSMPSHIGALERVIMTNGQHDYLVGNVFRLRSTMFSLQMMSYQFQLEKLGYSIEDIIKWFFEVYLKEEFQADNFIFHAPSKGCTTLEKIRLIATEIDSVLKQFRLYCSDGMIDRELLEISSSHIVFDAIPSMIKEKYLYIDSDSYRYYQHLLFSDQSLLNYAERLENDYNSFYELLSHEHLYLDDLNNYQKSLLQTLLDNDIAVLSASNEILLNTPIVDILKEFYDKEVICYSYKHHQKEKDVLNKLLQSHDIRMESALFTEPEQDYLNYMLNKAKFSNGNDLRNKYIHGTNTSDENKQDAHYIEFLKIMILIVIKINEEFFLRELLSSNTP